MEHVDEELLALIALGERGPDRAHLDSCPQCSLEVEELRAVVEKVRSHADHEETALELDPPPSSVWGAIHSELGLDSGLVADPLTIGPLVTNPLWAIPDDGGRTNEHDSDDEQVEFPAQPARRAGPEVPSAGGDVVPLPSRQPRNRAGRSTWAFAAAAAAVGLVFGGVGTAWLQSRTPEANVLAETQLDPLGDWTAQGSARVEVTKAGTHELVVNMPTEVVEDGYREVWLIDKDVTRLVSLGILTGSEATFAIPAGLDLADFPIVDVSLEPFDGDPTHSGDSILRGTLPT